MIAQPSKVMLLAVTLMRRTAQEFLAALPCYQERAITNDLPAAGEPDICLEDATLLAVSAKEKPKATGKLHDPDQSARKLNNLGRGGGR